MAEYRHLRILTLAYAGFIFLGCLVAFGSNQALIIMIGTLGLVAATIQLSAMWAVLGPGQYLRRMGHSLLALGICGLAGAAGLMLSVIANANVFNTIEQATFTVLFLCVAGFGVWVAAQLPFWICRFSLGWHIGLWRPDEVAQPVTISNLMIYTAMIAAAIALYQFFVRLSVNNAIPDEQLFVTTAVVSTSLTILIFFLIFTVPAVVWILFPRESKKGGGFYAGWTMLLILYIVVTSIVAGGPTQPEPVFVLCGLVGSYGFFLGLALVTSREVGFVLWSNRRRERWTKNPPSPYLDPFDPLKDFGSSVHSEQTVQKSPD